MEEEHILHERVRPSGAQYCQGAQNQAVGLLAKSDSGRFKDAERRWLVQVTLPPTVGPLVLTSVDVAASVLGGAVKIRGSRCVPKSQ